MGDEDGFTHYEMSPEVRALHDQVDRRLWSAVLSLGGAAASLALMSWHWQFIVLAVPLLVFGMVENGRKEDASKRCHQLQRSDFEHQRSVADQRRRRAIAGEEPRDDASLAIKLRYVERVRRMNPDRVLAARLDQIELEAYRRHVGGTDRLHRPGGWEIDLHLAVIDRLREVDTERHWRSVCDAEELLWRQIAMGARDEFGAVTAPATSRACIELLKLDPGAYFDIVLAHRPNPFRGAAN